MTTGGLRQYEYPTNTIMSKAIWKASLYAARAIDPKEGVLMGHYQPRSHHFKQLSLPWEEHANTLLGLARLHTHLSSSLSTNNNDNHSHNSNNNKYAEDIASAELVDTVLMSLKQGFSYMTKHLKGYYIPFPPLLQKKHRDEKYQCLLTILGKSRTARLAFAIWSCARCKTGSKHRRKIGPRGYISPCLVWNYDRLILEADEDYMSTLNTANKTKLAAILGLPTFDNGNIIAAEAFKISYFLADRLEIIDNSESDPINDAWEEEVFLETA